MAEKKTKGKAPKSSDFIGFRSKELSKKLRDIVEANPGKVTMSQIVRIAVEEKLQRMTKGEDPGIALKRRV